MVETLLAEAGLVRANLTAVAFGQGPGGFTGLRVACGVTQGIAYALKLPVIAVPSLLAVAVSEHPQEGQIEVVALDARMGELYVAAYRYDQQQWETLHEPILLDTEHLALWIRQLQSQHDVNVSIRLNGDVPETFPDLIADLELIPHLKVAPASKPTVEGVAMLAQQALARGDTILPEQAMPLYVRDKVAFTTSEREQGMGGNPSAQWRPLNNEVNS